MAGWSHFLPLLPLLLLLRTGVSKEQSDVAVGSCSNAFSPRTCPAPPTVQDFDLSAYVGKWYEIGSTARFKLSTEPGLACVFANYTLAEAPTPTEGANVTVLNSGIQVVGKIAQVGIRQFDIGVAGACSASRNICDLVSSSGPIQMLLEEVKELSAELTGDDASNLTSAVADIEVKLHSLQVATNSVIATLKKIGLKGGDLSQAVAPKSLQLEQFEGLVRGAHLSLSPFSSLIRDIHAARARFITVAQSLLATSPGNIGNAFLLLQAYTGIGLQEEAILVKRSEVEGYLRSLLLAAKDLIQVDDSSPLTSFSLTGFAEQSASNPSKLQVYFPIPGQSELAGGPYWVIAITGEASQGYEAAVVYSCTELPGGELDTGIFILSRTRTLSTTVVDSLLTKSVELGFVFGCDNSFIFTVQDHPSCQK